MNSLGKHRFAWPLLACLAGLPSLLSTHPSPAWTQGLSLRSPQHLGLAGAGAAWSSAEDPAVRTRLESPQLKITGGQDHLSQRSVGTHAWIPVGPGRNLGLGAGLGPDAEGQIEGRLRAAWGQRLRGPQSPALGIALSLRDRISPRDRGLGLGIDMGMAWVLPWQKLELGAALRELPVASAQGSWRREGACGIGWRRDGLHLALDLSQAVDEALTVHAGAEQRLNSVWDLQAGVASPSAAQEPWTWGAGIRRRHGDLWWSLATRQPLGSGAAALKLGLGWDLKSQGPSVRPMRLASMRPVPTPSPTPVTGGFKVTAQRSNGGLSLSWPEQAQATGYEVLMALVPGASMRQAPEGLVSRAYWEGQLGLPGVTYYFKVRVLGQDGTTQGESWVLAVSPEAGAP